MIELVIPQRRPDLSGFEVGRVLPYAQRRMVGPFVFFDHMGPVDMAPGVPRSVDVRPHPHIGLATVTYLFSGEIMHRDSVGSEQAIRPGEVNWMTAGRGITHSERFERARREVKWPEQVRVRECPEAVLRSFGDAMASPKASCGKLRRAIDSHVAAHPELQADLDRLLTIPAVGPKTALRMLGLLRGRGFESAREVAAFLGLVPVEHQSGTRVRGRPKLSKAGNPRLRAALYMAAVAATQLNLDVRAQHRCLLERGKSKMAALGAAMRKLVHLCFGVLKSGATIAWPQIRFDEPDSIYIRATR